MVSRAPIQIEGGGFGFFNAFAALNHDGACVTTGKIEGRKHSGRSEAHHYWAKVVAPLRIGDGGGRLRHADICFLKKMLITVGNRQAHLIIVKYPVFFACVNGLTNDAKI